MISENTIAIELTSECTSNCVKCYRRKIWGRGEAMDDFIFERVLNGLKNYKEPCSILLATGESILEMNKVIELIDWSNFTKNPIRLLTTGVPLIQKNINLLAKAKYLSIQITLDGLSSVEVENVQRINLEKVKEKIGLAAKSLNIIFNYTLTNKNYESLPKLVEFAHTNKITEVFITPMMEYELCDDAHKFIPQMNDESIVHALNLAREKALLLNIKLKVGIGKSPYLKSLSMLQKRCQKIGMLRPIVRVDGKVSICWGREDVLLGDLKNDHLDDLLYSKVLFSIREKHNSGNLSEFCDECIVYKNSGLNVMKIPKREPSIPIDIALMKDS